MACAVCKKFDRKTDRETSTRVFNELVALNKSGVMTYLGGDCALEDTMRLLGTEEIFSVVQRFKCGCGATVEWGECIRGSPLLRYHDPPRPL